MARRKSDSKLDSKSARERLPLRREPYWCSLSGGLALGYRRGKKGGHWLAKHYSPENGRRYTTLGAADDTLDDGVLSFAQAQIHARQWLTELAKRAGTAPSGPYTVNQACDDYLDYLRSDGRSAAAVKDAIYKIDAFIRPKLGKMEVSRLKAATLRKWRAEVAAVPPRIRTKPGERQKHRKSSDGRARKATANRILTVLKAALNHAFDEEHVASNSAWGRRVEPYESVDVARARFLQVAEAQRLMNACDNDFRQMVQAALQTGARYSEIARLQVRDFDESAATVFIAESKSGKARYVRLSKEGVSFFRQCCLGRAGDDTIFVKENGTQWQTSQQIRRMKDACERAEIVPAIGFHGLRHTYASLHIKNGAKLHIVALNLGHVTMDGQPDVRMVTRHYAHLEATDVADAVRKTAPTFGLDHANIAPLRPRAA